MNRSPAVAVTPHITAACEAATPRSNEFVPPRQPRPDLPPALEDIILQTMALDPLVRPASAADLEQSLLAFCRPTFREHTIERISATSVQRSKTPSMAPIELGTDRTILVTPPGAVPPAPPPPPAGPLHRPPGVAAAGRQAPHGGILGLAAGHAGAEPQGPEDASHAPKLLGFDRIRLAGFPNPAAYLRSDAGGGYH